MVLLAVTLADLTVIALGPLIFLIEPSDHRGVTIATVIAVVLLPVQAVLLWKMLREITVEHRRTRGLRVRIRRVLIDKDLRIAFQPIVAATTGLVVEAEALSRFSGTPPESPDVWFAGAAEVGLDAELELMAVDKALRAARQLPGHCRVGINVSPAILADPRLVSTIEAGPVDPHRVTVEVTEHTHIEDYGRLQVVREQLRQRGIHVAVDDVGSGYASFRHLVALAPDVIKLDRTLVSGLDTDQARRALVAAMVMFAQQCGAVVLAEGVETTGELRCLAGLGVDLVQGYLTGSPTVESTVWQTWSNPVRVVKDAITQQVPAVTSRTDLRGGPQLPQQRPPLDDALPPLIRSNENSSG